MVAELTPHARSVVWLHWLMALALVGMVFFGLSMSSLPLGHDSRPWMMGAHLVTGLLIFAGAVVRLKLRRAGKVQPLPAVYRRWERGLANGTHGLFYVLMLGLPVLGFSVWLLDPFVPGPGLAGQAVALGNLAGWLHWLHYLGAWLLLAALIIHIVGALRGLLSPVPERHVLKRMLAAEQKQDHATPQARGTSNQSAGKRKRAGSRRR